MKYQRGQSVIVTYMGVDHPGEIRNISGGDVLCKIARDPEVDYGGITDALGLYFYANVHESDVKPA